MDAYSPTKRTKLKRVPKRALYDKEGVYAILDAGVICHVGYVIDGSPYVTPTAYWRHGNRVYWHGSSASRMLRTLECGVPVCLTVTHLDGFVMARSGFHHSINYRSVMAFGIAQLVASKTEKIEALEHFTERLFPGRWKEIRGPNEQEIKATKVLWMELEEVSAKVRTGPPVDDEPDYALPCWAGVLPLSIATGVPVPDPRLPSGTPLPAYFAGFKLGQ
ncbi:MAG TPA: pyridoxamine 5'-phosphate oxidase family protein [Alphaproteobacteria bacterium]|nr:pyridoxamine 5'-phosphate oxidase family protein [Alphaproteobacteria bacterium]